MPIALASLTTGSGTDILTADERDYIREVLGISLASNDKQYIKAEARFSAFSAYQNKSARYWMTQYEAKGESTMEIEAEGASISKVKDRQRIALALYNLVFALNTVTPIEDIDVAIYEESTPKVTMVSIQHTDDEYAESEY